MYGALTSSWSLRLGRWQGCEVRLHIHFPLLALAVMLAATVSGLFTAGEGLVAVGVWLASVAVHEGARMVAASRVGGRTHMIVLAPTGGLAQPHLPADPPAHLVTALAGPTAFLGMIVAAACALVALGRVEVLGLLSLFAPELDSGGSRLVLAMQLAVWINAWLLLVNLVPAPPLDGAELLRGLLWPLVGRASATAAMSHFALGAAAGTALLAVVLQHQTLGEVVPAWFPLSVLSVVLLYGGNRLSRQRRYDVGLDIEQLQLDESLWLQPQPEEDREAVLVEHLQQRQEETIDRKRRQREDLEDARVDDILARLTATTFDKLSEEEQAILRRASRRYRRRRHEPPRER
ncbi:MAG: hypothetical protein KF847_14130 [Pirellulales bacterium]|nr:hypothetical protein [Pirellulales bacterium]